MIVYYNELYVAGTFTKYEDLNCFFTGHWNEATMTRVTDPLQGSGIRRMHIFQNLLFGTNAFNFPTNKGLATYNMDTWNSEPGITTPQTGVYSNANYIFSGSDGGQLTLRANTMTKYDLLCDSINGAINAITEYQNYLIIGGNFTSIKGKHLSHIAMLVGSTFTSISGEFDGNISRMLVYENNLYVCGNFQHIGTLNAKFLARWDGSDWSEVGGGLTSTDSLGIMDMIVYNKSMFVAGKFSKAGNVNTNNIAMWNDSAWTAVDFPKPGYASSVEVYNHKLYAASFNADSAVLYRSDVLAGIIPNSLHHLFFTIYPNPASTEINILLEDYPVEAIDMELMDINGKVVQTGVLKDIQTNINAAHLQKGVYLLHLKSDGVADTFRKIVIL